MCVNLTVCALEATLISQDRRGVIFVLTNRNHSYLFSSEYLLSIDSHI